MPAGTKVAAAEQHIEESEARRGVSGRRLKRIVFGRLNNMGMMHGNKPTEAGLRPAKTVLHSTYRGR